MEQITITRPNAKVNFGLSIVGERPDGYHELETVFYPVALFDTLTFTAADRFSFRVKGNPIEGDSEHNLVVRAYRALQQRFPDLPPVEIELDKQIPMQAGMGGGSADGAYTLTALNRMFGLGLDVNQLRSIAAGLGADCPFFIESTPSYATGIGEQLEPIFMDLRNFTFVIVQPPVAVSTREAFAHVVCRRPQRRCIDVICQDLSTWREQLVNDFEESVFAQYPVIGQIKQRLYEMGAVYASMSGSGSAVFGLFGNSGKWLDRREEIAALFPDCFTTVVGGALFPIVYQSGFTYTL